MLGKLGGEEWEEEEEKGLARGLDVEGIGESCEEEKRGVMKIARMGKMKQRALRSEAGESREGEGRKAN